MAGIYLKVHSDFDLEEIAAVVQLPSDLLCLKELDEESCPPYAVFAKVDLESGNLIGTYKGNFYLDEPEEVHNAESYFKVSRNNGCPPVHVMLENGGHWLKLMRSAPKLADANICIRVSGPDIDCRVIQRVTRGVELRVTCSIGDQDSAELESTSRVADGPTDVCEPLEVDSSTDPEATDREAGMLDSSTSPAAGSSDVDGMVEIKNEVLANPSDCSSENSETGEKDIHQELGRSDHLVSPSSEITDCNWNKPFKENNELEDISKASATESVSPTSEMSGTSSEAEHAPKGRTNSDRAYKCPLCTYVCYSEQYLVKHVTMHDVTLPHMDSESSREQSSFCEECNIHFMSVKTYQAHKDLYCKARREAAHSESSHSYVRPNADIETAAPVGDVFVVGKNALPNGIPPVIQPHGFFAAISTNPLILLPCSVVNGQGFIPQNNIISTGAPIVLPGGITGSAVIDSNGISLHPRDKGTSSLNAHSRMRDLKHPALLSGKHSVNTSDVLDLKKTCTAETKDFASPTVSDGAFQDAPLDLTIRKRKSSAVGFSNQYHGVKRRSSFATTPPAHLTANNASSPEMNYPHAAISPPSFSNDASSSSGMGTLLPLPSLPVGGLHSLCKIPNDESTGPTVILSALESASQQAQPILPIGLAPAKMLKQGNNRCEYCNIIFYKYDNYLAHKKHYCAFRRQQMSAASESLSAVSDASNIDDNSNNGTQDHLSNKAAGGEEKPIKLGTRPSVDYVSDNSLATSSIYVPKPHSSVFPCDACGVKFSTADNLNAHQSFYCAKILESSYHKYGFQGSKKSPKGRDVVGHRNSESENYDVLDCPEEWKCNYCEVVCPSLKAARKHLLTHTEMRGFCCIICGYRGNTLRGMRTHVYEHMNGSTTSQIEDILANSIVVDAGNSCSRSMDCSDEESPAMQDTRHHTDESAQHTEDVSPHIGTSPSRFNKDHSSSGPGSDDEHKSGRSQLGTASETSNNEQTFRCSSQPCGEEHSESTYPRTVNLGTLCDVVIKTEDDDSAEKIVPERMTPSPAESLTVVKDDPDSQEEEIDVEKTDQDKEETKVKLGAVTSVICRVSAQARRPEYHTGGGENSERTALVPKKRTRVQPKSELKYCKSCDISFHHLSNFIAHKKFYCVSRVIESFQHETAPVQ